MLICRRYGAPLMPDSRFASAATLRQPPCSPDVIAATRQSILLSSPLRHAAIIRLSVITLLILLARWR